MNVSVTLLSMEGQKALEFHQKYLHLCSEDERRSYCFRIAWGWEINDNVDFWVNYPLSVQIVFGAIASHLCRHCFHLSHDWTYSLNLGEQTMAMDSGSSIWYEQWVCRSTLDRKAVWVGWVCGAERQRHLNDYCRKTTVCLHCTDRQSRKLPFQSEYYFLIDPFKILHCYCIFVVHISYIAREGTSTHTEYDSHVSSPVWWGCIGLAPETALLHSLCHSNLDLHTASAQSRVSPWMHSCSATGTQTLSSQMS